MRENANYWDFKGLQLSVKTDRRQVLLVKFPGSRLRDYHAGSQHPAVGRERQPDWTERLGSDEVKQGFSGCQGHSVAAL